MLFTRTTGGATSVLETTSKVPMGTAWNVPTTVFSGGKHPSILRCVNGDLIRCCYSSGAVIGTRQRAHTTSPLAGFTFSIGSSSSPADDTFSLQQCPWSPHAFLLHIHISGDSTSSMWVSHDHCATWTRLGDAISGGTRPSLSISPSGSIIWSALIASGSDFAVQAAIQSNQGSPLQTPFTLLDGGSDLLLQNDTFHLAQSAWSPSWVLRAMAKGDTDPSDWESLDRLHYTRI